MAARRSTFRAGATVAVVLVSAIACSRSGAAEVELCSRAGTATVCLRSANGGPFKVSGEGFAPRSSLGVNLDSGAGRMVPVDDEGRLPGSGGALGFVPGPVTETHVLEGTDRAGAPVSFRVTCSLGDGKRPICRF